MNINDPLPMVNEGDPAWMLSAEMANLLVRKVNAMYGMRVAAPLRLVKADAGFTISAGRAGLLPENGLTTPTAPTWQEVTLVIDCVPTQFYVLTGGPA